MEQFACGGWCGGNKWFCWWGGGWGEIMMVVWESVGFVV